MTGKLRVTDATLDVLEVLLGPDDELYGFKIAKEIDRPTGSVFPILARLEQAGWVFSKWETSEQNSRGSRRRFYRLSPDGVAQAREMLAEAQTVGAPNSAHLMRPADIRGGGQRSGRVGGRESCHLAVVLGARVGERLVPGRGAGGVG